MISKFLWLTYLLWVCSRNQNLKTIGALTNWLVCCFQERTWNKLCNILWNLYIIDDSENPSFGAAYHDPLAKIRSFHDICQHNFKHMYKLPENISLDEGCYLWKGCISGARTQRNLQNFTSIFSKLYFFQMYHSAFRERIAKYLLDISPNQQMDSIDSDISNANNEL